MAILTSKGARAPHQLKGRRNVRISRDRRGSGSDFVGVSYDSENKKIQQTIGGETSDVVTVATLKDAMNLPADVANVVQDGNMNAVSSNAVNEALSRCQNAVYAPAPDGGLKYIRIKYTQNDEPTLLISFKGFTTVLLNVSYYVILLKEGREEGQSYVYGYKNGYEYNSYIYISYNGWRVPKILNISGSECEIENITKDEYDVAVASGKMIQPMNSI